ncbi:hypothetical protein HGRIS_014563 [Hohenbuehelia grisea]|uniref:Uncharacterized protein n=1 Tax=Hohenbuehelia grisea TaxID=104357 RepID=A0ABR3JTU0_9AGAR
MPVDINPMGGPQTPGADYAHNHGFRVPDPFAPRRKPGASFMNALFATALFRCWHILCFFAGWAAMVALINEHVRDVTVQTTLLTVVGTVLGFVVSYRTTSSFERYNEGRRLWAQIIFASRTFARTVWFHVPDSVLSGSGSSSPEELKARAIVEKKTILNLIEAFGVALKHYLRGEDGIYYEDLYYLVKFLPEYAFPAGLPSQADLHSPTSPSFFSSPSDGAHNGTASYDKEDMFAGRGIPEATMSAPHLPLPVTSSPHTKFPVQGARPRALNLPSPHGLRAANTQGLRKVKSSTGVISREDEAYLLPAHMPPAYHLFDLFPFSLIVKCLTKRGKELKGKKAARLRARLRNKTVSHNIPLEISLYLDSYIAAQQQKKLIDVPTINLLLASLNQLVDGLTGLERILTTPIPFSYSIHLWTVTTIYCLLLPFQIWKTLGWLSIPGTVIAAFFFYGFLVAGEEIENPFGYDKNDLVRFAPPNV